MLRVKALDGLRGLAILLVMLFHTGLLDAGWMGVNLFFVLSGYLITQVLLPWTERDLGFYLKRFWWRRSLRIFPLFYTFIGIVVVIFLFTGLPHNTLTELPYLLTYSINFRGLFTLHRDSEFFNFIWSLCVEEQFYLVWPLVVFFFRKKNLGRIALAILILSPLLRFGLGEYWAEAHGNRLGVGGAMYILPFTQLDGFMIGAFLAIAGDRVPRNWIKPWFFLSLFAFAVSGAICYFALREKNSDLHWSSLGFPIASWALWMYVWLYTLLASLFGSMVAWLTRLETGMFSNVFSWAPLRFLGKISYGLYLIHLPLNRIIGMKFPLPDTYAGRLLYFIPFAALSILIAWISFQFFESRFLKMKDRRFNS